MYTTTDDACGIHLVTDRIYTKGELICQIENYQIVTKPTYQTIQIGRSLHLEELGIIAYMNHSCQPNTLVDTANLAIRATREIAIGESLTFFYPSTEWEMDRPFVCLCGAPACVRLVAGAKYLSVDVLRRYFINQHIRDLITAALVESALIEETSHTVPFLPAAMGRPNSGYFANGMA